MNAPRDEAAEPPAAPLFPEPGSPVTTIHIGDLAVAIARIGDVPAFVAWRQPPFVPPDPQR